MIRTVVKWSYVKGEKGLGKAKAHINYVGFREGEDRGRGARQFFSGEREQVQGREIKERLDELEQRSVQVHKFILSPGLENVSIKDYTRELMEEVGRSKGLDLEWYAVEHRNTEHVHAHVVVMGTDLNGREVEFRREDSKHLREWGDRYLEREHKLERYLDKEIERLLAEPTKEMDLEYERGRGDRQFERWMYGDERDKRERGDADRDRREWETLDRDLHKAFVSERSASRSKTYKQYQTESAGRLLDVHERYQEREAREYWSEIKEKYPEMAKDAERQLEWLDQLAQERPDKDREPDLDRLLDGRDPFDRLIDEELKDLAKECESFGDLSHIGNFEREGADPLRDLLGLDRQKETEPEEEQDTEKEREDEWQTFENDRMLEENMGDEREEDERDYGDDLFERGDYGR